MSAAETNVTIRSIIIVKLSIRIPSSILNAPKSIHEKTSSMTKFRFVD